ncbi:porphobilinogen deaminase, dipyromethane cofactor binding domain-containing protein [Fimicolochytrium jonesii]|uniref:porphobilinogen deaminase, dipyromethane cofactor binding domain-containing protein n=1 Tax=Fimicolochytrium jonesii TaxID=1396493 RepID=UPI0022FF333B|nr:porphobilinogen deaminase, dipyromethane cofactor binding domain-containing protein [Fimicolochytrium jonesii]KAI8825835.1 porphobilinogen deaminase, dipyromethane cofactor binding domain-containing protein [Fimicolochytrium jonesii]
MTSAAIASDASHHHTATLSNTPATQPRTHFVIGTRQSQLAMVQAEAVLAALQKQHPTYTFTIHGMTTKGDKVLDTALSKIGSKSLFTKELEVALANGTVDLVVHSLKDLQTVLPEGMTVGAMTEREDPRDALVVSIAGTAKGYITIEDLPDGSIVGSSSVRRIAQLKRRFPNLIFQDVRGNLNTRLSKLDAPQGPYTALLLAYAGLHRLGWNDRISYVLPPDTMLHAVGQGALGIECREDDVDTVRLLAPLDHWQTRVRCTAERSFMRYLEGGCSVPLGVWTELELDEEGVPKLIRLKGSVSKVDGSIEIREEAEAGLTGERVADLEAAEELGKRVGDMVVAKGARDILEDIKRRRVAPLD